MATAARNPTQLRVRIAPPHPQLGDFRALDTTKHVAATYFADLVGKDPRMNGRVLDVGCGANFPRFEVIRNLLMNRPQQLDGLDPMPEVTDHPGLTERWCGEFETLDLPAETWDALFTFWVAEHISDGGAFFEQAYRVLKPGGVLYALTPHAVHPFAMGVRFIEWTRLRALVRRMSRGTINDYPAYYRINRLGSVMRAAADAGFTEVEFHYIPTPQWQKYFHRLLRPIPRTYDRLIGCRYQKAAQVIAYRVEKPK